ncbi:unnamed protein product, partial [marine sediment metagenome]
PLNGFSIYTIADMIKALSTQQREIGFVEKELLGQIYKYRVGRYLVYLISYRDPKKYTKGVSFEEPESEAEAVKSYGPAGEIIWRRHRKRKRLARQAQECKICPAFMPAIEELIPWGNWFIAIQPFPITDAHHFVLINEKHMPQTNIDEDILRDVIEFSSQTEGARLFYNGVAASIVQHLHLQGVFQNFPIEDAQTKLLSQREDVKISELIDWPIIGFLFESESKQSLTKEVGAFVDVLKGIPLLKDGSKR